MPLIKNTNEKLLIALIQKGFFKRKRKPNVIPIYNLTTALNKVNKHKLAKEVAFCLTTKVSYRLANESRYQLAFNTVILKSWDNIAVVEINKDIKKFNQFVCVDLVDYNNTFINKHPIFMKLLFTELNIIRKL